ncbi:MAG: PspC domain-containing protein [Patescibacteria group bacterium]|jgi:phage shock protein C
MEKRLYRSLDNRIVFGVASGLGEYYQIDPTVVRLILIILTISSGGIVLWLYLIAALVLPSEETNKTDKLRLKKSENKEKTSQGGGLERRSLFGLIIILVGATSLFNQIFPGFWRWDIFWPLLMVFVGVYLILK